MSDAAPTVTPSAMTRERAERAAAAGGSRVRSAVRLWRGVRRRMRAGLRAEFPDDSPAELDRRLADRLRSVRDFRERHIYRPAPPDADWIAFCRERGVEV
ncbi:hypothetical protein [Alienimonas sp. DA493]|uniref:hypothetical protein n=1 Tax=Alienimonas sp. DA493 TaxID=3373605 RepID=UPI0037553B80